MGKWHPVKDLKQWLEEDVEPEGTYLFTFRDDEFDETSVDVDIGTFEPGVPTKVMLYSGFEGSYVLLEDIVAWMELPEPYKPTPDACFKCNHGKVQHGESSDNWFECELLQRDVPPNGKPNDCPLNG